jgi:hypothetical protein
VFGTRINHFPFSDHDIIITKLKTEDINRGPGMWIMNLETIKSEQFTFSTHQINHFYVTCFGILGLIYRLIVEEDCDLSFFE